MIKSQDKVLPVNGLIIKPNWADMVLSGTKPWEIRGRRTNKRGTIGIIKSGSSKVFGTVNLVDCVPLFCPELIHENLHKHHVSLGEIPY
ncbi:ASCH domain-containing protein [Paenibacillus polysaccharolyticus]|uniref:ASCH domain-containing protein n=1 Tax=Paenibacillus polysaccharolyticus TaxID=582692 RepID=UPI00209FFB87|nr:ASCH domain-containing protein [Paenibacillus polysaccharolyticus]MCP1133362.1 ASCH domain-containing protein [Paenibacillus polysaccharolyticus]